MSAFLILILIILNELLIIKVINLFLYFEKFILFIIIILQPQRMQYLAAYTLATLSGAEPSNSHLI